MGVGAGAAATRLGADRACPVFFFETVLAAMPVTGLPRLFYPALRLGR